MYFVQANMSATAVFGLNLTLPRVFFWLYYQSGNSFVMNMVEWCNYHRHTNKTYVQIP